MVFALYSHPDCTAHKPGQMHPESPARMAAIMDTLQEAPYFAKLTLQDAPKADIGLLEKVHTKSYISRILNSEPRAGYTALDSDTLMSKGSVDAALRGAGSICALVDDIIAGRHKSGFCAVRPPGHHAEKEMAFGFCLFGNIAAGAIHALENHNLERVAIVDFDVHHGNGTQDLVKNDPRILFVSTHQMPLFPGTGYPDETGCGNCLNIPLSAGMEGAAYRNLFEDTIIPRLRSFKPDMILVSAGFDAHRDDPLATVNLETEDFAWLGEQLSALSSELCKARLASILEGGYNLEALGESTRAYIGGIVKGLNI